MTKLQWLIICTLLPSACATVDTSDIEFQSESHPYFLLGSYGSYSWSSSASIVFDYNGRWEPPEYDLDSQIKFLIDSKLRSMGLVENAFNPDLVLRFSTVIDIQTLALIQDPQANLKILEQSLPQGALSISMFDNATDYLVWIGVATGNIDETPDTETSIKRLQYTVTNLLDQLPN